MKHSSLFKTIWRAAAILLLSTQPFVAQADVWETTYHGFCLRTDDGITVTVTGYDKDMLIEEGNWPNVYLAGFGDFGYWDEMYEIPEEWYPYFTGYYDVVKIEFGAFQNCQGMTSIVIPSSVVEISKQAFYGCSDLTAVYIDQENLDNNLIIGEFAFCDCSSLTKMNLPNNLTSLRYGAFMRCNSLTNMTIPDAVTSIGSAVFYGCSSMTNMTIGKSVNFIGDMAFVDCPALACIMVSGENTTFDSRNNCNAIINSASNTLVTGCKNTIIPNSVTSIGDYAFYGCTGLTVIDIPKSVTTIGQWAFTYCSGLTNLTISDSVTSIGVAAFMGCSGLTSIVIPNSIKTIEANSFTLCKGLTGIEIPDSVTRIGEFAFSHCSAMTSLTIGESVSSIARGAFMGCSGLTRIDIPNSVDSIGYNAFADCNNLTNFRFGNSVTFIDSEVFVGCTNLASIESYIKDPNQVTLRTNVFKGIPKETCILHVPNGTKELYMNADQWKDFATIIDDLEVPFKTGDVNGDGSVNISDVTALIDYLLSGNASGINLSGADCNQDSNINISDVTKLIDYLLSGTWN